MLEYLHETNLRNTICSEQVRTTALAPKLNRYARPDLWDRPLLFEDLLNWPGLAFAYKGVTESPGVWFYEDARILTLPQSEEWIEQPLWFNIDWDIWRWLMRHPAAGNTIALFFREILLLQDGGLIRRVETSFPPHLAKHMSEFEENPTHPQLSAKVVLPMIAAHYRP
jgi:hypothetical protein